MVEPIFFLYISISIISYGIQVPLFIFYTRKLDSLLVTTYSRLSLIVTMLPLLLFVPVSEIIKVPDFAFELLLASAFGATGFILNFRAAKYIAVGIGEALRQAAYIGTAVLLGFLFLNESLPFPVLMMLFGIIILTISLVLTRSSHTHLDPDKYFQGVIIAIISGLCFAGAFYYFSIVSRSIHPFVSTYFWMAVMGILSLLFLLTSKAIGKYQKPLLLPPKKILYITIISLTTITGSVSYAFAINHGFFALASGLAATSTFVAVIGSWVAFKEKLNLYQVLAIVGTILLILGIRLIV